jgi:hypothetical protein
MAGQYELRKFLREVATKNLKDYFASIKWDSKVQWEELCQGALKTSHFGALENQPL